MHREEPSVPISGRKQPRFGRTSHRAAVLTGARRVELQQIDLPEPGPDDVRVRVLHCGVCASNVLPWQGRPWFQYPFAPGSPGHEAVGEVESVGYRVDNVNPGDRVAYLGQNGFAEFEVTPANHLLLLTDGDTATNFLGEPLACAMNIFRRAEIKAGQTVAIIGVGFLGALLVQLAVDAGARVIAMAQRPFALALAKQSGAETLPFLCPGEATRTVAEMTRDELCDVTIESTGKQLPLDLAAEITKVRGRLVIAGYHQDGIRQINMQLWNWRGFDVINAHERDPQVYLEGMKLAFEATREGRISTKGLITHHFPLDGLNEALQMADTRPDGFLKAVVRL
jgi:2-desacetyl-2-hydroxyethyl bacteriochlorophyllide A dehydrogenase